MTPHCNVQYPTAQYRTASHSNVQYDTLSYRTLPPTLPSLPYPTVPYPSIPYPTVPYRMLPYPNLCNKFPTRNLSCLNRSYRINTSCPILLHTTHNLLYRYPTIYFLNLPYPTLPCPAYLHYPTLTLPYPYPTLPYMALPCPVLPCPALPCAHTNPNTIPTDLHSFSQKVYVNKFCSYLNMSSCFFHYADKTPYCLDRL